MSFDFERSVIFQDALLPKILNLFHIVTDRPIIIWICYWKIASNTQLSIRYHQLLRWNNEKRTSLLIWSEIPQFLLIRINTIFVFIIFSNHKNIPCGSYRWQNYLESPHLHIISLFDLSLLKESISTSK